MDSKTKTIAFRALRSFLAVNLPLLSSALASEAVRNFITEHPWSGPVAGILPPVILILDKWVRWGRDPGEIAEIHEPKDTGL